MIRNMKNKIKQILHSARLFWRRNPLLIIFSYRSFLPGVDEPDELPFASVSFLLLSSARGDLVPISFGGLADKSDICVDGLDLEDISDIAGEFFIFLT